ncbi:MAG: hypothetical protein IJF50_02805 [Peptococcaceae bacterium]|nr:hypothetical protein [Peptococcaceae bacterium]
MVSRKDLNSSQILIETFVKKALHDAEDGTRRTVRNLVDLAMQFSNGRFQKNFFALLQTMLQNEHSAYYDLITDILLHVEKEQLLKLGMNIGYNSCTAGASRIREIEAAEQFNIPWCMSMEVEEPYITNNFSAYQRLIAQGQSMGIHTWFIYTKQAYQQIFLLAAQYPDSAFVLLCEPETITEAVLEELCEHQNLMVAIHYTDSDERDSAAEVCRQLRKQRLLYSLYYFYEEQDIEKIRNGDLFDAMQQLRPAFVGTLSAETVDAAARLQGYDAILEIRSAQKYAVIVLDLQYDLLHIDRIISDDCCTAGIDKHGRLCSYHERIAQNKETIFDTELKDLLKQQFPKSKNICFHECECEETDV